MNNKDIYKLLEEGKLDEALDQLLEEVENKPTEDKEPEVLDSEVETEEVYPADEHEEATEVKEVVVESEDKVEELQPEVENEEVYPADEHEEATDVKEVVVEDTEQLEEDNLETNPLVPEAKEEGVATDVDAMAEPEISDAEEEIEDKNEEVEETEAEKIADEVEELLETEPEKEVAPEVEEVDITESMDRIFEIIEKINESMECKPTEDKEPEVLDSEVETEEVYPADEHEEAEEVEGIVVESEELLEFANLLESLENEEVMELLEALDFELEYNDNLDNLSESELCEMCLVLNEGLFRAGTRSMRRAAKIARKNAINDETDKHAASANQFKIDYKTDLKQRREDIKNLKADRKAAIKSGDVAGVSKFNEKLSKVKSKKEIKDRQEKLQKERNDKITREKQRKLDNIQKKVDEDKEKNPSLIKKAFSKPVEEVPGKVVKESVSDMDLLVWLDENGYEPTLENLLVLKEELELNAEVENDDVYNEETEPVKAEDCKEVDLDNEDIYPADEHEEAEEVKEVVVESAPRKHKSDDTGLSHVETTYEYYDDNDAEDGEKRRVVVTKKSVDHVDGSEEILSKEDRVNKGKSSRKYGKYESNESVEYTSLREACMLDEEYFNTDSYKLETAEYKYNKLVEQVSLLLAKEAHDPLYEELLRVSSEAIKLQEACNRKYRKNAEKNVSSMTKNK